MGVWVCSLIRHGMIRHRWKLQGRLTPGAKPRARPAPRRFGAILAPRKNRDKSDRRLQRSVRRPDTIGKPLPERIGGDALGSAPHLPRCRMWAAWQRTGGFPGPPDELFFLSSVPP